MANKNYCISTYVYHTTNSKKLLYEEIGTRLFYIAEDIDENYLFKKYIRNKLGTFKVKDGRGRVLTKYVVNYLR